MSATQFKAAQAATLARRDALRDQAHTLAAFKAAPASHDDQVAKLLRSGYHVEIQTAELTQLVRGHRVNHILHLLLTVFTAGLWLPVWLLVALVSGEKRKVIAR